MKPCPKAGAAPRRKPAWFSPLRSLVLAAALLNGCRTAPPLPPADFSAPGWRVSEGQAVWKPAPNALEIPGELMVASDEHGGCVAQFSKPPFALVTAQAASNRWHLEFHLQRKVFRGEGDARLRFVWFQLPWVRAGNAPGGGWAFERHSGSAWRLQNRHTGEVLEGFLAP